MTAGVTSGAVTMKITSSTSMTSTYGTMLMSCIGPRLRRRAGMSLLHRLAMEDVGELLHEALEAIAQALDVVRVAVVRYHRRDGGEQADRRGDERLGDAGRHLRERRLLNVRQAAKRVHDAPYRAEQADIGTHRPGRGEKGQMALEEIHLALEGGAHRAPRPVHHVARVGAAALPAQLGELTEAGLEDALQAADGVAVGDRALVERGELVAAPELALELLGLAARTPDREPLLEDEHPRQEGHRDQQYQHHLDDDAGVDDQGPDIEVLRHVHLSACSSSWGMRAGCILVGQQIARRRRRDDAEVAVRGERGDAPAQRPLQEALLDEEGLEHVLDGFGVLADGVREVVEADRAARELLDHREQQLAVHDVEPQHVDVEHLERGLGDELGHGAIRLHLRVVPHAAQYPVGDARRAARAAGDLDRSVIIESNLQQARGAAHDRRQLVLAVELQARDDAEAVAQRVGQHAGARGGAGERERRQIELDRARRRALADHDVDLEILERGVQDLLDHRRQAVDLVDEQHVPGFQIRQDRGEISRALENRPRGLAQIDPHFARDDVRERGLAQPRRAEQQHVVQRLAARARRLDEDLELAADLLLPDILGEAAGPQRALELLLLRGGRLARDQPVGFNAHELLNGNAK